jgi:hypothetical protein
MPSFGEVLSLGLSSVSTRRARRAFFLLLFLPAAIGCAKNGPLPRTERLSSLERSSPNLEFGTRWLWAEASCSDGPLELVSRGFDEQLRIERAPSGQLLFWFERTFAAEGCVQTIVWSLEPTPEHDLWLFREQARIALPASLSCQGQPERARTGTLRRSGDLLEITIYESSWCRGFDARFVFRRAPATALDDLAIIRHWAANFNRRDPEAMAALFAERGSLAENLNLNAGVLPRRFDGRETIKRRFVRYFVAQRWVAMRLIAIEPLGDPGHYLVQWQYLDDKLIAPLDMRNRFLIADREIYQIELQLLNQPL